MTASASTRSIVTTEPGLTFTWRPPAWMIANTFTSSAEAQNQANLAVYKGFTVARADAALQARRRAEAATAAEADYRRRTRVPRIFCVLRVLRNEGMIASISSK